jgi:hypothetical protein
MPSRRLVREYEFLPASQQPRAHVLRLMELIPSRALGASVLIEQG